MQPSEPLSRRRRFLQIAAASGAVTMTAGPSLAQTLATGPIWTPVEVPPQVPASEGLVDVGGAKLWYWDTGGAGPAVVFMHAGTQSGAGWGYQQPVFAAAGYRVIGYSRRGYYRSEGGDAANPGVAAEDLRLLLDHLRIDRAHLVSLAHGAFFAIDFALSHPQRVRTLTVACSYLGVSDAERDYVDANARLRPKGFEALPNEVKELHPSYRVGNPAGLAAWKKLEREAVNGGARITPKRHHELTWARLESIRLPRLLMTGDGDLYTPPALLRMQAQHMPGAEVHVFAESGHSPNWEQPAAFNERVLAFLRSHPQ